MLQWLKGLWAEKTTKVALGMVVVALGYWIQTGEIQGEALASAFWLLILKGRGQVAPAAKSGVTLPSLAVLLVGLTMLAGCGLNQEPSPRMLQSTRGPNTPQEQQIRFSPWVDIHHVYVGAPATQPSADRPGMYGYASAGSGSGRGYGSGFNFIMPVWLDASSSATPTVGSMNPVTGAQSADTDGELSPRTQVIPSLAFGMPGSAVTSSSSGTGAFDNGQATGAPTTVSPTQTPQYLNLRVPSQQLQGVLNWLQGLIGGAQPNPAPASLPAG